MDQPSENDQQGGEDSEEEVQYMDQPSENDQQGREDSEEEVQSRYTGVPVEFKNYIRALIRDESMYIDDGILLIQKPLSDRDVDSQKGRFSFTSSPTLMKKYRHDRSVILIEPSLQNQTSVYFRKKKKKKSNSDEDSTMYVLDTTWNEVVTRNNLEAGQIVQLWAVGVDEKYCFALHRLTTEEGNNAPGSSGGSSGAAANPSSSSSSSSSDSSDS